MGPLEFNSYGARRGHHEVMMRGTFGNIRLHNRLADGKEGPYTTHLPSGDEMFIYDAAMRYGAESVPLVVLAGREYGSGSSRDWAAKGTTLLGVKAVIAEIVRADPPLEPRRDGGAAPAVQAGRYGGVAGADGARDVLRRGTRRGPLATPVRDGRGPSRCGDGGDGSEVRFEAIARLDGPIEVDYYRGGGILPAVLRRLADRALSTGDGHEEALGGGPRASSRRRMFVVLPIRRGGPVVRDAPVSIRHAAVLPRP